jgi:hypothetical protein
VQEKAIVYYVVAMLGCLLIDLIVVVARGPIMIDPILKLLLVAVCLIAVVIGLARHGWLLSG